MWFQRIQNIGRPAIYALLVLCFMIPLMHPIGFPLNYSAHTNAAFELMNNLPEGSIVLQTVGFNPAVDAEVWPQMLALAKHWMSLGVKIIYYPVFQEGVMYASRIEDTVAPEYGYKYGEDFVILPFKAGGETAIAGLGDFYSFIEKDVHGSAIAKMPLFEDFSGISDLALAVAVTGSEDGYFLVRHINEPFKVPIIVGGTAPVLPAIGPYLSSGQIEGAIIGLSGAAQYEIMAGVPGSATGAMDAQSMGHLLITGLVVLGNVGFLVERKKRGKGVN